MPVYPDIGCLLSQPVDKVENASTYTHLFPAQCITLKFNTFSSIAFSKMTYDAARHKKQP